MLSVAADLNGFDAAQLRDHLKTCVFARGRMHRLRCALEAVDDFLARRFVTTLTAGTLVLFAGIWLPL